MNAILKALLFALGLLIPGCAASAAARNPAHSSPAPIAVAKKPDSLDYKQIHALYHDGNFEQVISVLEGYLHRNPVISKVDSVFIAKHLAVVYTANPATREKGKYYMRML